jgi:enamine deaminase RidA (YjgF/YER057c/UK114 family)
MQILHPPGWAPAKGYANGVVASGRMVFLGGQIGWDAEQRFVSGDLVAQIEQALRNIVSVLAEAGGEPRHIVRLTWYVTDRDGYLSRQKEIGAVYRAVLGRHFPAMSMVQVVALAEAEAKVEIEATAVVP